MSVERSAGTQVVEFELGAERYCLDIDDVAEVVDVRTVTKLPNAPRHVRGVMDLRGRTTTIVDPTHQLGIDGADEETHVVVFDTELTDGASVGWVVGRVDEVSRVDPDAVDETAVDHEPRARGVVRRDDELFVWLEPQLSDGTVDRRN